MRFVPLLIAGLLIGCQSSKTSSPRPVELADQPVASSTYEAYDRNLSLRIQQQWHESIHTKLPLPKGKVVVSFKLHTSGQISDIKIVSTDVEGDFNSICTRAVDVSGPDLEWSESMKQTIGQDHRKITVGFHY